ncbi:MAG: DUF1638 domain-containing protein [Chloroflexota bacterium]|nr:DUF1638 domain-containing protein [Chloroflexota bacterium]
MPARPEAGPSTARATEAPRVLVIGCGALARELLALTRNLPGVKVLCVDAALHMRPERIADAVSARIDQARRDYGPDLKIFVAYADCGTRGALDEVLAKAGVERIVGAHCYEFYAGAATFAALQDEDPGTFYLTDFLTRQFDTLIIRGLGLDKHPELLPLYFGNYQRLVYLAQSDDPALMASARRAAKRLGLGFEHRTTGFGDLATATVAATTTGAPGHPGTLARGPCSRAHLWSWPS